MDTNLDAATVSTSDQDGVVLVGFADRPHDTRRYVLLQRMRRVSEEERARGEHQVHLEVDGQHRSAYGAVAGVVVERGAVRLALRAADAAALGLGPELRVTFQLDDLEHARLVDGLRRLWEHAPEALVVGP